MKAQAIMAPDFPELVKDFEVIVVPKIWVNDRVFIEGYVPGNQEKYLLMAVKQALDPESPPGKLLIPSALEK